MSWRENGMATWSTLYISWRLYLGWTYFQQFKFGRQRQQRNMQFRCLTVRLILRLFGEPSLLEICLIEYNDLLHTQKLLDQAQPTTNPNSSCGAHTCVWEAQLDRSSPSKNLQCPLGTTHGPKKHHINHYNFINFPMWDYVCHSYIFQVNTFEVNFIR